MAWLKALVIGMGVLIVAGIGVVAVTLVNRMGGSTAPSASAPAATGRIELPPGARIAETHVDGKTMKLTGPEAEAFWPIYREYEKELAAVGDQKLALIREFMGHYRSGTLSDQNAKAMTAQWLKNTQARLDLWKKYHRKISKAVSPIRAAQFLQVENQVALFVDMSIASEMPEIAPSKSQSPPK